MSRNAFAFPAGGVSFARRSTSARERATSRPISESLTFPALPTSFLLNNAIVEQIADASAAKDAGWPAAAWAPVAAEFADDFVASDWCVVPQAVAVSAMARAEMAANRVILTRIGLAAPSLDRRRQGAGRRAECPGARA